MSADRPRIHLIAPAGSCRAFVKDLGLASAEKLIALVQTLAGPKFSVCGDAALIEAEENERRGGRDDDQRRAEDLQRALSDDAVAAIVSLRGGAWFTRVLPRVDFTVLERRKRPVTVFGFSELTTLVNIVASYRNGRGVYDMGPAFLKYGLRRHAAKRAAGREACQSDSDSADGASSAGLVAEVGNFFNDVVSIIEGRGSARLLRARALSADLPPRFDAAFAGGNLTVLSTLIGSCYSGWLGPAGRWLVLEDFNDRLERIDRFLAHLTLARIWEQCAGILLGDFHNGDRDLTDEVIRLLPRHVPDGLLLPVMTAAGVGHVWPMSPLPLHLPVTFTRREEAWYSLEWPAGALRAT